MQRDVDIWAGNQLAFNRDDGILRRQWRSHQQRGEELAGYAAVHFNFAAGKAAAQAQRRIVFLLQIINLRAALAQRVDQMANRALFHARFASQHDIVAAQTQRGRQRTHGGPCVTEEQLQRTTSLQRPSVAGHFTAGAVSRQNVMNSQGAQGIQHMAYIVAVQQVGQHRGATGQSRQQQSTVRDTF